MARNRTFSKHFLNNEELSKCSHTSRILYHSMSSLCDDSGILIASILNLKNKIFLYESIDEIAIQKSINELIENNFLKAYKVKDHNYWRILHWDWQIINRPTYKYPLENGSYPQRERLTPKNDEKITKNDPKNDEKVQKNVDLKKKERNKNKKKEKGTQKEIKTKTKKEIKNIYIIPQKEKQKKNIYKKKIKRKSNQILATPKVRELFDYWRKVMAHPDAVLDEQRVAVFKKALKARSLLFLKQCIDGCAASRYHRGDNEHGIPYDGIDVIFRSADRLEKFHAIFESKNNAILYPKAGIAQIQTRIEEQSLENAAQFFRDNLPSSPSEFTKSILSKLKASKEDK